jgi:site-specific recombinase XerD
MQIGAGDRVGIEHAVGHIALVQRALNHRSIASTTAYVRVPDERLREALRA